MSTDQPSLQVFTGSAFGGTLVGGHGRLRRQGDGIALETQRHADAPNQPAFASPLLLATQAYRALTTFGTTTTTTSRGQS